MANDSDSWHKVLHHIIGAELSSDTTQTTGMRRLEAISGKTVGSQKIWMGETHVAPSTNSGDHHHGEAETAIYVISGESHVWHGEKLEQHVVVRAGELFYIPAGVPHLPANLSDQPVTAVLARTDPNEQESVVLLPELDALVPSPEPVDA